MKNNFLLNSLAATVVGLLLTTTAVLAQTPGSGGPTPTNVPIDGGASLLLASGVALGLKKLRDHRRTR